MWWALAATLGCSEQPVAPAVDREAEATLFRVKVWAGDGVAVEPWRETAFEGLRFYRLSNGHRSWGALVAGEQPVPLDGVAAFRATLGFIDLDLVDDGLLAGLAMLLLEPGNRVAGGVPWTGQEAGDTRVPRQQAIAQPPARIDEKLTYWHWHESGEELVRCRVMLDSLYVACEAGSSLVDEAENSEDVVARARRELATDDPGARVAGVHRLTRADSTLAGGLLMEVVRLDTSAVVREAAVAALGHLQPAGGGEVLMGVLLNDSSAAVRQQAAVVLPAFDSEGLELQLQVAAKGDPDPEVRMAAAAALRKLQRGGG